MGWKVVLWSLALAVALGAAAADAASDGASEQAIARGRQVYNSLCWSCHGRYGRGDGPAAAELVSPPPDFTNPDQLGGRTDEQILERLRGGGHTPMSIANMVKPEALSDALAFIRTMSVPGKRVSVLAGREIYQSFCWSCHGLNGDGKGPAGRYLDPPPRDFTAPSFRIEGREREVYRAIALGPARAFHGAPYMPAWSSKLSSQEIADVMEYLKTFKRRTGQSTPGSAGSDQTHRRSTRSGVQRPRGHRRRVLDSEDSPSARAPHARRTFSELRRGRTP